MIDPSDDLDLFEILSEEYIDRVRRGENPAIEEYCAKYPSLADDIRELFPALAVIEGARPEWQDQIDESRPGETPDLEKIGDYRLLGEIGRGGMGVVYEAEQESLGRRVALKVLPTRFHKSESSVIRFRREARAAARMHHTNIVPVFDVGEDGEFLFYAMQLIRGQGLDAIIDELSRLRTGSDGEAPARDVPTQSHPEAARRAIASAVRSGTFAAERLLDESPSPSEAKTIRVARGSSTDALVSESTVDLAGSSATSVAHSGRDTFHRSVARIGFQTAGALAYSHTRGIVHRDIKPSNLLLDAAGVVWVTDFGLAQTEENDLTKTGDIVGTVRYMSPERFEGRCDERADIYALGLTLYELLLLKPAFESTSRASMIDAILHRDPPTPRSIDPRVPRDLETVVLRAIDKDADRRYQSAEEFAEDLARFIRDEPIKARRVSSAERFLRWSRRNKALSASLGTLAVLLVVAAVASTIVANRFRIEKEVQEGLAQDNADLAAKADARRATTLRKYYFAEMNLAGQASTIPFGLKGLDQKLERWRPADGEVDHRGWEWYYLKSLIDQERLVLTENLSQWTWCVAWHPDGSRFAISVHGRGIAIASAKTGELVWKHGTNGFRALDWNPDGTKLAATSFYGQVFVIDVASKVETELKGSGERLHVYSVDWHPNGNRLVTGGRDGHLRIWDVPSGREVRAIRIGDFEEDGVRSACWSPDGRLLAAVSVHGHVKIWNSAPSPLGTLLHSWNAEPFSGQLTAVCWSPAGTRLAVSGLSGKTQVCDLTGRMQGWLETKLVYDLAWHPSRNLLLTANALGELKLWDLETNLELRTFRGHIASLRAVAWNPDGTEFASAGLDGSARVWNLAASGQTQRLAGAGYYTCEWSSDGKTLVSSQAHVAATIWNPVTGTGEEISSRGGTWVECSADGKRIAFLDQYRLRIWERTSDKVRELVLSEQGRLTALAWNPDQRSVLVGNEAGKTLKVNVLSLAIIDSAQVHDSAVRTLAWCPRGELLASGDAGGLITVRDTKGQIAWDHQRDSISINEVRWSRDGERLACAMRDRILILQRATGEISADLDGVKADFNSVDWTIDGSRLAVGSSGDVSIRDATTGDVALILNREGASRVRFSPAGKRLATNSLSIWDATRGWNAMPDSSLPSNPDK
ncbi:MAG: protein kinase [Planctomycetota bacterium]